MEEDTQNDFTKIQIECLKDYTYYKLIYAGVNYEKYFFRSDISQQNGVSTKFLSPGEFFTFKRLCEILLKGYIINNNYSITIPYDEILGFYLNNGNNLTEEDYENIKSKKGFLNIGDINKYIIYCKNIIENLKNNSLKVAAMIQRQLLTIDSYKPLEYIINENNDIKFFNMFINENESKGREVNEMDALIIFNKIETSQRYPVIIYFNSRADRVCKFTTQYSVDFNNTLLNNLPVTPNTIIVLSKSGNPIILNFTTKKCKMTILSGGQDNKIKTLFSMIYMEEENISNSMSATITYIVDNNFTLYNFYEYLITDEIMSSIFYVDETSSAWCSKEKFYIFFEDYSDNLFNLNDMFNTDNFRFSFINDKKKSLSGITIKIEARNKQMLPSFLYKFSRLLSNFLTIDNNLDISNKITKLTIFTKTSSELISKAPKLFGCDSKIKGEKSLISAGSRYCKICSAGVQPIIAEDDEIQEWINYGRKPVKFPPEEWGFKESYWIVCPKDSTPNVTMKPNFQDLSGKVLELPCCIETEGYRNSKEITKATTRTGTSDSIGIIGSMGSISESLESFLKRCFSKDKLYGFNKIGTSKLEDNFTIFNSAIIALLYAKNYITYGAEINEKKLYSDIIKVRELMSELPIDIYKQELYDMNEIEIRESILNPETYIDPYLYYRGLEIIFDVQIFVFVSNIGRDNPLSETEDKLDIPTLEIPRCKYTHIRNDNEKDIVLLYKNHGTNNRSFKIAPCELLVATQGNLISVYRINSSNKLFNKNIYELLDLSCHSFEWSIDDNDVTENCYESPFNTINWNKYDFGNLGDIKGQLVNTFGKTDTIIFNDWIFIIPPTQPFLLTDINGIHIEGVKKFPELKTVDEATAIFDVSLVENDCVWLEFNGKIKGIKIPIKSNENLSSRRFGNVLDLVVRKNNLSTLLQFIHWLWREEYHDGRFPIFIEWWDRHTVIEDSLIFDDVPNPKINCNNMMLPINLKTFEERLAEITKIWPFFFYRGKIHVSKGLYERIRNNFNIEDIYSRGLTPEDIYGINGKFIIDLIPTDSDYKTGNSIILTKDYHIIDWLNRNSSLVFKYESLMNCMIINNKLTNVMRNIKSQYLYRETSGCNEGKIYLIQNSSIISTPANINALGIAYFWKVHRKNPGTNYICKDEIVKSLPYVVYSIKDGILIPSYDKSEGNDDYLQIIRYEGEQKYGAMLPIL